MDSDFETAEIGLYRNINSQGGAAFPINTENVTFFGMTFRDYLAAKALAGLCANPGGPFQANAMSGWSITNCTTDDIARECYGLADAMLRARVVAQGE